MDWTQVITTIVVVALPSILAYIFGKLGIDKLKFAKYEKLWTLAREGVYWAKDISRQQWSREVGGSCEICQ